MLNKTKFGDCSQCSATDTNVVKIRKELICCNCNKRNKAKQYMAKARERNLVRSLVSSDKNIEVKSGAELQRWFEDRRKEMLGKCMECSDPSTKHDDKYWKFSICHILAKSLFPSVATHPLNFVELCYFGNSHHSNMDNNGYEYVCEKMPKTWDLIIERVKIMYPSIKEKSKIPDIILQELGQF